MKEKYIELSLKVVLWENSDVIVASVEKGDNIIEDSFFE